MRVLLLAFPLVASLAHGQVTKSSVSVSMPNCASAPPMVSYQADVYRPSGAGPFPLVAFGHGFQNSKDNYEQLARALGAEGVAVIVPQFPSLLSLQCGASDHARNGRILLAAIDQQLAAGGIDAARLALAGHSAGGLSAFLAASERAVAAVMLLDATDQNGLGLAAAPNVAEPTLSIHAEPSSCNQQGNSTMWFTPKPGLKARFKLVNGSHCEPQEPVSGVCTAGCGGAGAYSATRAALYKSWAVAFFGRFLLGRTTPCLDDLAVADATAGRITSVDFQLGGCGAGDAGVATDAGIATDAGAAPADAGVDGGASDGGASDAGASPADAGSPELDAGLDGGPSQEDAGLPAQTDAGQEPVDGGADAPTDGGVDVGVPPAGCGCASAPLPMLLGLLALGAVARRRRPALHLR